MHQETHRNEQDWYAFTHSAAKDTVRAATSCPDCEGEKLFGWSREDVLEIIQAKFPLPKSFYRVEGYDPDLLYTPCLPCEKVSDRIHTLTAADIAVWVLEDECNCVLDQTCAVCRLAARIKQEWRELSKSDAPTPMTRLPEFTLHYASENNWPPMSRITRALWRQLTPEERAQSWLAPKQECHDPRADGRYETKEETYEQKSY